MNADAARRGLFVASLDFELFWGMIDKTTRAAYGPNILGVREAIPGMLALFDRYGIRATWAVLGLIAFSRKEDLLRALPRVRPAYADKRLSPYRYIETAAIGADEDEDPYHFGASLIRELMRHEGQEIASHTFSHYYCLEEGQDAAAFRADLAASRAALAAFGVAPVSLVLPRNQSRLDYMQAAAELGFESYRGNQRHWLYRARAEGKQINPFIRALRLLDHYVPLSGHHIYAREDLRHSRPYDLPASMFLRPYSRRFRFLEPLKVRRITAAMTAAAKEGKLFHLWWHPHNFGAHTKENLRNLERILRHARALEARYGMRSVTMAETADALAA